MVLATAGSGYLAILDSMGIIDLYHNWLSQGWVDVHGTREGEIDSWDNLSGTDPGFEELGTQDYHLSADSDCVDTGDALPSVLFPEHALQHQYVLHQHYTIRSDTGAIDMGAFGTRDH